MRKIHLLMPTILVASSIPMVSMVGCNKNNGPIIKGQLTFTATEDCKFMIYADEFLETWTTPNLEYSKNGENWEEYEMPEGLEPGQQIVLRAGDTIKFRGDNPKGFSYYNEDEDDYSYYSLFFGSDTDNPCGIISGNIMSLLSKDNFQSLTEIPCDGCFYSLFEWSEISDASNLVLPATELADWCYSYMFYCCSFLASAPSLPDAVLAEGCYSHMFYDCDSLKIKQQDTKTTDDGFVFTCPSNIPAGAVEDMFYGTSGSWAGDPTSGKSYYWYT